MDIEMPISFAPSGQVLQQLLDSTGRAAQNEGVNAILARLEDFCSLGEIGIGSGDVLRQASQELIQCIDHYLGEAKAALLVVLCPASPSVLGKLPDAALAQAENLLAEAYRDDDRVTVYTSSQILTLSTLPSYHDEVALRVGMIPYTPPAYAVFGAVVARYLHALMYAESYKVVIVDCDNTLWTGLCGEDGPDGIIIDEGRRTLQEELVRQTRYGRLLCLCSRNNESDVWSVFESRSDMPLRREHITSYRINWDPKHVNLQELAIELNISQGAFVFLDDDPVVCSEVESILPEILTFHIPDSGRLADFVQRVWAFDKIHVTDEDRSRAQFYRQEQARKEVRSSAITHEEFLRSLQLDVQIETVNDSDVVRVSQLLMRTTQFNSNVLRPSASALRQAIASGAQQCSVVRVRDRFGDYGLVGCLLYRTLEDHLRFDAVALSCRVLGKGVEMYLWNFMLNVSRASQKSEIQLLYHRTERNGLVDHFFSEVGAVSAFNAPMPCTFHFRVL